MMSRSLVIKASLVFVIVLSIVAVRVFYLQRAHYMEAERHFASGELKLAVREYGTAIGLHFPLSPYTSRSAQRLWNMGREFEEGGELLRAQAAFSEIRSSFYGVRSLYTPGRDWIEKCDERIAHIRATMLLEEGRITPEEFDETRAKHLAVLRTDRAPAPLWSAAAGVFFASFMASVVFVIFRGLGPDGRPVKRTALAGFAAAACFFALWVLSLFMA